MFFSTDRWFPFHGVTKSGRVRRTKSGKEAWSMSDERAVDVSEVADASGWLLSHAFFVFLPFVT